MSTLAFEFNDADILVASETELIAGEPGYALLEGSAIRAGQAAYGQARLKPKQISADYWSRLSLSSQEEIAGRVVTSAELAFTQLRDLWRQVGGPAAEAVFVVPGSFTNDQLGILLGLAQECEIPVRAMVDAAVAASDCAYTGRDLLYVDASLRQISVTELDQAEEATLGTREVLDSIGLVELTDRLARSIAEAFVLQTRFDPLHDAATEQQLYDALPEWLASLRTADRVEASMTHADDRFTVTLDAQRIRNVAAGFYRAVVQLIAQSRTSRRPIAVQLSERLARWPGMAQELARLDDAVILEQPRGHAPQAALRRLGPTASLGGGVRLLKHLPFSARREIEAAPRPTPSATPAVARPTHVVYAGIAYCVERGAIVIGRTQIDGRRTIVVDAAQSGVSAEHCEILVRDGELRLRDTSRYGTFVNEKRVSGEVSLHPADVIRVGTPGAELQVVRLEESRGA